MIDLSILKKILLITLMLISLSGNAQKNKKAIKYLNLGVIAFNKKDYKAADSLYNLSIKYEPNKNSIYNLALTKKELGDYCGYCKYLKKAHIYGKNDANHEYSKNCIKRDTVTYDNIKEEKVSFYCVASNNSCLNKSTYIVYKKYLEKDSVISFEITPADSLKFRKEEFLSPSFNMENEFREMPSYPGGGQAMMKFISENVIYPDQAKNDLIVGTVIVTFVVEVDGTLTDIKILRGIGGGCDEEALRVVKMMQKWTPGKLGGKPARIQYNLPFVFILE